MRHFYIVLISVAIETPIIYQYCKSNTDFFIIKLPDLYFIKLSKKWLTVDTVQKESEFVETSYTETSTLTRFTSIDLILGGIQALLQKSFAYQNCPKKPSLTNYASSAIKNLGCAHFVNFVSQDIKLFLLNLTIGNWIELLLH